jgi:hypothetical protein
MKKRTCISCAQRIGPSDYKTHDATRKHPSLHLCLACWNKVARAGRRPKQTVEAVLYYLNDPGAQGPDDILDHEDYRDLERLGIWPESE